MVIGRGLAQTVVKPRPVGDQQRADLTQPGIVFRQNFQNTGIFKMIFQNAAFLLQNPVVLRQCRVVIRPEGAQRQIAEPPPLARSHFQDHQIFRAKQHRRQHPGDLPGGFLLRPVQPQLPGTGAGKQNPSDALLPLLREYRTVDFPEIFLKPHHFRGFLCPEAFPAAKIGYSLQQVGFSLGVIPHDQVDAGVKLRRDFLIISERPERQLIQIHG